MFYVEDATWGGYLKGTQRLSPTSEAMIENSGIVVGIGGGEVARDELLEAKRSGRKVRFLPADMNHEKAREGARRKGLPPPTDFRGAAHLAFEDLAMVWLKAGQAIGPTRGLTLRSTGPARKAAQAG